MKHVKANFPACIESCMSGACPVPTLENSMNEPAFRSYGFVALVCLTSASAFASGHTNPDWSDSFTSEQVNLHVLSAEEQEAYRGAVGPMLVPVISGAAGAAAYVGGSLASGNTPTVSGALLAAAGGATAGLVPGLGLGAAGTAVIQGGIGVGTSAAIGVMDRGPITVSPQYPHAAFGIGGGCDPIRCIYKDGVLRPRNFGEHP